MQTLNLTPFAFTFIIFSFYSEEEIKTFLDLAAHHELDVIPLIQTFGHFEVSLHSSLKKTPLFNISAQDKSSVALLCCNCSMYYHIYSGIGSSSRQFPPLIWAQSAKVLPLANDFSLITC